jgi:uncharacterized protein (UPF0248 family)
LCPSDPKRPPSPTAREVLNELKWREDREFTLVKVYIVHRGVPDDTRILQGSEILTLDQLFFQTAETPIPYHRIFKITYEDEVVFTRDIPGHIDPDKKRFVGGDTLEKDM